MALVFEAKWRCGSTLRVLVTGLIQGPCGTRTLPTVGCVNRTVRLVVTRVPEPSLTTLGVHTRGSPFGAIAVEVAGVHFTAIPAPTPNTVGGDFETIRVLNTEELLPFSFAGGCLNDIAGVIAEQHSSDEVSEGQTTERPEIGSITKLSGFENVIETFAHPTEVHCPLLTSCPFSTLGTLGSFSAYSERCGLVG